MKNKWGAKDLSDTNTEHTIPFSSLLRHTDEKLVVTHKTQANKEKGVIWQKQWSWFNFCCKYVHIPSGFLCISTDTMIAAVITLFIISSNKSFLIVLYTTVHCVLASDKVLDSWTSCLNGFSFSVLNHLIVTRSNTPPLMQLLVAGMF